ncbi:MAG: hypothetical protein HYZ45_02290, partial [Burkholderiales bacterium]|nr:hypothetical protein [Burkholderiales bacterium]
NEASSTFTIKNSKAGSDGKPTSSLISKDLLKLLAAKRAPFGLLPDADSEEAIEQLPDAERANVISLSSAERIEAQPADSAPQLSSQLLQAKNSFQQKGNSTLRHIAAVQQARHVSNG